MKFQTSYGQKYLKHKRNLYIKLMLKNQVHFHVPLKMIFGNFDVFFLDP